MSVEKINVMVVDDDSISNFVTVRHLQQIDSLSSIKDFINPFEALRYLEESRDSAHFPQLILLDINMPQLTGWSFLEHMQRLSIVTPKVFMLTSSIYPEDFEKSKAYNLVCGFIVKPLDKAKIKSQLQLVDN